MEPARNSPRETFNSRVVRRSTSSFRPGEPGAHPRLGIGMSHEIRYDRDRLSTGGEHRRRALRREPADGDERAVANSHPPVANSLKPLRSPFHDLELGLVD